MRPSKGGAHGLSGAGDGGGSRDRAAVAGRRWGPGDRPGHRDGPQDDRRVRPGGVAVGVQRGGPPPTDDQVAAITAARRPGRPTNTTTPVRSSRPCGRTRRSIRQWLGEALRLTKIHRRLRAMGLTVSYSSLYRFARVTCDFGGAGGDRTGRRPAAGRGGGSGFRRARAVEGFHHRPVAPRVRLARDALLQPVRVPRDRAPAGPHCRARRPGGRLAVLRRRRAPRRRRQSHARRHPRRSLHARPQPGLPRIRAVPRLPRRPGRGGASDGETESRARDSLCPPGFLPR